MATRIVHFGVDERAVLANLANCGYDVEECGTSIPKLSDVLQRNHWDAVVVEEDSVALGAEILATARSFDSIPFILFRGQANTYEHSHFDLVIPPHIPANDWLRKVEEEIDRNRAVRAKSRLAGRGFDLETATQGRGLGLISMKERVRLIKGTVSIESTPLHRTSIRVHVPLTSEHDLERAAG